MVATVEGSDACLRLRQAEAAPAEAGAAASNARAEADRQVQLFERGVAAEAARDRAVTQAEQAEARVEQQRRTLDLLREDLADTDLRAPFDGIVNTIEVQAFGSVAAGQPVVTLYREGGLQAQILVSYDVATRLALGQEVWVRPTDGPRDALPARVTEIACRAPAVSSFPVVVTLDETREDLRSGMAVEVLADFPVPEAQAGIPLPLGALATQRPASMEAEGARHADVFVFAPGPGGTGTLEVRQGTLGAVAQDRLYVTSGLQAGDRVVTAGVPFLREGMTVELEDGAPGATEVAVR